MDGRGVPLSLVVTGANVHDVTQIETVLDAIVVKRPAPKQRRSKHLCADAGYRGKKAMKVILAHGYIAHVVSRKREADQKKKDPKKRARRWVVDAIPVVGFADDLGALAAALGAVAMYVTDDVKRMAADKMRNLFGA